MRINTIKKITYAKVVLIFISILSPFVHPHVIRQNDSMGIAMRYWLRWFTEPSLKYPLYPALIQAGDFYGIQATEFPILYILFAPIFSLPHPWSIFVARILLIVINLGLTYWSYKLWEEVKLEKFDFKMAHLLLLVFGITNVYFGKFMPDYTSFILVSISVAFYLSRTKIALPILLSTIGLLIKPPAAIGFAFVFLCCDKDKVVKSILKWMLPAFIITILYYTLGTKELNSLSDIPRYFYSEFRSPVDQLVNFVQFPKKILQLLFHDVFSVFLLTLVLLDFIKNKLYENKTQLLLWGILLMQVLGGVLLDGKHLFVHNYYIMSTGLTVGLIFSDFLKRIPKPLFIVVTIVLGGYVLDKGYYANRMAIQKDNLIWQCSELKDEIPNEYKIRTKYKKYAKLGTCMGMIQNSKTANYGVYEKGQSFEGGEVIKKTKDLILVKFN